MGRHCFVSNSLTLSLLVFDVAVSQLTTATSIIKSRIDSLVVDIVSNVCRENVRNHPCHRASPLKPDPISFRIIIVCSIKHILKSMNTNVGAGKDKRQPSYINPREISHVKHSTADRYTCLGDSMGYSVFCSIF